MISENSIESGALEMTRHCKRFVTRRALLTAAPASVVCGLARGQEAEKGTFADAIRLFAHEKSAAEQYGVILVTLGKNNVALYLQGIKLYADAKAEFDGLIAELRFDLQSGQEPAASAKFNEALKAAAEKRVAFTSFVSDEIAKGTNGLKLDRVVLQQHRLGKGEERRSYTDHYPVGAILRLER